MPIQLFVQNYKGGLLNLLLISGKKCRVGTANDKKTVVRGHKFHLKDRSNLTLCAREVLSNVVKTLFLHLKEVKSPWQFDNIIRKSSSHVTDSFVPSALSDVNRNNYISQSEHNGIILH